MQIVQDNNERLSCLCCLFGDVADKGFHRDEEVI
jgi:hypothetical protein